MCDSSCKTKFCPFFFVLFHIISLLYKLYCTYSLTYSISHTQTVPTLLQILQTCSFSQFMNEISSNLIFTSARFSPLSPFLLQQILHLFPLSSSYFHSFFISTNSLLCMSRQSLLFSYYLLIYRWPGYLNSFNYEQ